MRKADFCFGSRMEDKKRGTVGRRNLASWCFDKERTARPEMAEYSRMEHIGRVNRSTAAGPIS